MKEFISNITNISPKFIHSVISQNNEICINVYPEYIVHFMAILKDHINFQYKLLTELCAVDYPSRTNRFELVYSLLSIQYNNRIIIKTYTDEITPINSVNTLFSSANWSEREIWDLYGVFFSEHPDLRRILTDYGFQGHPLRKDYPLSGYTEVRYDDLQKRVVYEPLEITQEFRYFDFNSPWENVK